MEKTLHWPSEQRLFLPEFDKALIGKNISDTFDIDVTFPADYRISAMQNRSVVFRTTLKKLRLVDYQPIDDEFAKDFSEYETLDEWKDEILANLQERRETSVRGKICPGSYGKNYCRFWYSDWWWPERRNDTDLLWWFSGWTGNESDSAGTLLQTFRSQRRWDYADKEQEAVEAIQAQSVLHAVAAAEKISITPEELAEELRAIAIEEDEDPEEFVETLEEEDVENIADQLTMDKTMAFILDSVIYDK